jgi:hypothetical protein
MGHTHIEDEQLKKSKLRRKMKSAILRINIKTREV